MPSEASGWPQFPKKHLPPGVSHFSAIPQHNVDTLRPSYNWVSSQQMWIGNIWGTELCLGKSMFDLLLLHKDRDFIFLSSGWTSTGFTCAYPPCSQLSNKSNACERGCWKSKWLAYWRIGRVLMPKTETWGPGGTMEMPFWVTNGKCSISDYKAFRGKPITVMLYEIINRCWGWLTHQVLRNILQNIEKSSLY